MLSRMTHAILTGVAEASPWKFGWEALVAIGTFVLALATGGLAWSTRSLAAKTAEEVKHSGQLVEESQRQTRAAQDQAQAARSALTATQEQGRIAQLTLNAQIRPVLIDVPLNVSIEEAIVYPGRDHPVMGHRGAVQVSASDQELLVSVPLRNAGAGLAMIRGISLEIGTAIGAPPVMIKPTNVAPGELGRVSFRAVPGNAAYAPVREVIERQDGPSVVVAYTDLAGEQMTLSRFDLYFRPNDHWDWEVRQVHFQEPGAELPYAGSAPVA